MAAGGMIIRAGVWGDLGANTVDTTKWMMHTFDSNFYLGATAERV
jgi:hypothetical protein